VISSIAPSLKADFRSSCTHLSACSVSSLSRIYHRSRLQIQHTTTPSTISFISHYRPSFAYFFIFICSFNFIMGRQEPLLPFNKTRPSRTRGPSRPVKGGLLQQLHNHQHHEPPATPKLTPRKAILAIFLALLGLSLLHRPVSNRYGGVPRYGNGLRTPEERARHILTTTPLIGKKQAPDATNPFLLNV
jgi:hypothetical protein